MRFFEPNTTTTRKRSHAYSLAILACFSTVFAQNGPKEPSYIDNYKVLQKGKELVGDRDDASYIPLDFDSIPLRVKSHMYSSLAFSLTWNGHPQDSGRYAVCERTSFRVYAAHAPTEDDLVEYRWRFMDQPIRVIASLNALRIDINLDELSANTTLDQFGVGRLAKAKGLVSRLLKLEGQDTSRTDFSITVPWPGALQNGTTFCTNPDQSIIVMSRWHQRIDFFVENNVLSILIYKKIPQLMGWQDGSKWFHDDFRAFVHAKAKSGK